MKRLMICPRECNDSTKIESVQVFEDIEDGVNRSGEKKRHKVQAHTQTHQVKFCVSMASKTIQELPKCILR